MVDYYMLPQTKRWLTDGDSPERIGGRITDLEQIGICLRNTLRELYPINCVPPELDTASQQLVVLLKTAEDEIARFIGKVSAAQVKR